jgi:cellulose synthase/poly-beta-1,6-N-acetylglucosamine synthase-like glycosyltransferase
MLISVIVGLSFLIVFLVLCLQVAGLVATYNYPSTPTKAAPAQREEETLPFVSILIAARNEELAIGDCLDAVLQLNYPTEKLEVLVGNDQSEDNTAHIVAAYAAQHPHIKLLNMQQDWYPQTKGKARVLTHLAAEAKGKFFFITDADIRLNPQWIQGLLAGFKDEKCGLVSGITIVEKGAHALSSVQSLDWLYFMSLINAFSHAGIPLTAVGNNMVVTREAYKATGGYERMPFSITEDYKLFREVRKKGYTTANLLTPQALVGSKPIPAFKDWLHQRKRWLKGGMELPFYWKLILLLIALFYFAMIPLFFLKPSVWALCWFAKFGLQSLQFQRVSYLLGLRPPGLWELLRYDLYLYIGMPLLSVFFILPGKVVWKGRKFS